MGRKKTPLNIQTHPGVGQAYIAQRLSDNAMVRVATLCTRDIKADPSLGNIRQFSGDMPYFKARITRQDGGNKLETPVLLTFDCREGHPCQAEADGILYRWMELDHKVAVESGMVVINDTPSKPEPKTRKVADEVSDQTQEELMDMEPIAETDFVDLSEIGEAPVVEEAQTEVSEAQVAEEKQEEVPFTKPTSQRKTWYSVVDGQVKSRRGVAPRDGEVATRQEAEALVV